MKKLFYVWAGCLCLLAFAACTDDENGPDVPPPSKAEESVKEIIDALESQVDDVSDFVDALKTVDVADLQEDRLTVFAVRDAGATVRSASDVLDSVSVRRHIAKGSYSKSQLSDGQKLESIGGDTLYISVDGTDVYVNGVLIEGEGIQAGNSYIYVVPQVLPEQEAPDVPSVHTYETVVRVLDITADIENPVPLDSVLIRTMEGDSLDNMEFVPTDELLIRGGEIVIRHTDPVLEFQLSKPGYSELENGYLLIPEYVPFYDGTLVPYADLNGDGRLDMNDRVNGDVHTYRVDYSTFSTEGQPQICCMKQVQTATIPSMDEVVTAWNGHLLSYLRSTVTVESLLCGAGDAAGSFDYQDVAGLSDTFWKEAYGTLAAAADALEQLTTHYPAESYDRQASILLAAALVRTQLYGYYNVFLTPDAEPYPFGALTDDLNYLEQTLPADEARAACLLAAKMYAYNGQWAEVQDCTRRLIDEGRYSLSADPASVFTQAAGTEIIWGGVQVGSLYVHPLLYREAVLLYALSSMQLGDMMRATDSANQLLAAYGQSPMDYISASSLLELCRMALPGTGALYPYYRLLEGQIDVPGFSAPKNYYLPIPVSVMASNPSLSQNPGY